MQSFLSPSELQQQGAEKKGKYGCNSWRKRPRISPIQMLIYRYLAFFVSHNYPICIE